MSPRFCKDKSDEDLISMIENNITRNDALICIYRRQYLKALGYINRQYQSCWEVKRIGPEDIASEIILDGLEKLEETILHPEKEVEGSIDGYCFGIWRNNLNSLCGKRSKTQNRFTAYDAQVHDTDDLASILT
jgi:hypothetical protein